jgi:hypothetical protein
MSSQDIRHCFEGDAFANSLAITVRIRHDTYPATRKQMNE